MKELKMMNDEKEERQGRGLLSLVWGKIVTQV
jgi:hypothetical protein